ncbi:hypothetical protein WME97_35250 [Sorangium sp. So ce367]|uniref:hypothetical protein n=1 Tax=Sorangium sp. So ce367 TaxID=3133305 RepID=UPI003F60FD14
MGCRTRRCGLGDGIVLPVYARIDWASLICRVYYLGYVRRRLDGEQPSLPPPPPPPPVA